MPERVPAVSPVARVAVENSKISQWPTSTGSGSSVRKGGPAAAGEHESTNKTSPSPARTRGTWQIRPTARRLSDTWEQGCRLDRFVPRGREAIHVLEGGMRVLKASLV